MKGLRRWLALLAFVGLVVSVAPAAVAGEIVIDDEIHSGIYSNEWDRAADFDGLAAAAGGRATFGGTFHDIAENDSASGGWSNTRELLNNVWLGRATPFANVVVNTTAYRIARGDFDAKIAEWASHVEQYLNLGQGRSVIIAPLQEANGTWVPYGCDPGNFKGAYRKFVDIFRSRGLDETKVRWAFAPNGWTSPGCGTLADYYPGDDYVDVLSFSGYNFGTCLSTKWETVPEVVDGAIAGLTAINSTKPILVAQSAAGRYRCGGDQAAWVRDLFAHLKAKPNVFGFIWFNLHKETDWRIWDGSWVSPGWQDGTKTASYQWPLTDWFAPGPLVIAPPTAQTPPCPNGGCDSVGLVNAGGEWLLWDGLAAGSELDGFYFGNPGDVPFMGDWDGDGVATPGLYRRSDGYVYVRGSNSQGIADIKFFFGNPGDWPVVGDFDGDGKDTVSIYRPSNQTIYIINELGANDGGLGAADFSYMFGNPGDVPFVGDFDGDGIDTVGLYRQSSGFVYFRNSLTTGVADLDFFYGNPGDVILAGDWDGDGDDTVAVYRPSDGRVYVNLKNAPTAADYYVYVGSYPNAVTWQRS
jgi:hypothetical protein